MKIKLKRFKTNYSNGVDFRSEECTTGKNYIREDEEHEIPDEIVENEERNKIPQRSTINLKITKRSLLT